MYLRFTTEFINEYNEAETGVFQALGYLRNNPSTQDGDVVKLKILNKWFSSNLEKPTRFSNATSKSPVSVSLSWFKDSAKEHLHKMSELTEVLEKYDLVVERLVTKNPGYIVYEDDYQVSAVPFRNDRNRVI
ncbi:hypothetical protein IDJ77_23895 [Mucilaginibacter sp. ZT4R22]|uniref:Uncharacterized protein n=1 Tax=Mucilaginibacter pankratovii TaxID=2772110 RepID=A0ABR7WZJ8_9SPHI|nr:hypothetical protein [Mucilaginibacter pankratovii]MBD1366874.1 hypothetical protein [Mucilaginibacter pankratovii]